MQLTLAKINLHRNRFFAANQLEDKPFSEAQLQKCFMISSLEFLRAKDPEAQFKRYLNRSTRLLQMHFEFDCIKEILEQDENENTVSEESKAIGIQP